MESTSNGPAIFLFSLLRYLLFMTRFTGRGVWYLYLGTMIWASLYNLNLDPFIGFILASFVGALGIMSIFYGKSRLPVLS